MTTIVRLTTDPTLEAPGTDHPLRLHAWMALSLAPLLAQTIDEPADRSILVADAVACWQALPADAHAHYQAAACGDLSPLELFGWDYHHQADQLVTANRPHPRQIPAEADNDEVVRAGWQALIHTVRQRLDAGLPPTPDWLIRFPGPATTLWPDRLQPAGPSGNPPDTDVVTGGVG
jgi:hypothetical protein